MCGARNLGEALRRLGEGAAMIRTKARLEPATGRSCPHARAVLGEIRRLQNLPEEELMAFAKDWVLPMSWWLKPAPSPPAGRQLCRGGRPPRRRRLMMQLGVDGVFCRFGHFQIR